MIGGWDYFFTNSDTITCPISTCNILDLGCSAPYSGANLVINQAVDPYELTANSQILL